jgi:ElaB/YqjD/DUF883 family membrane-anchored ribosome-binding protein
MRHLDPRDQLDAAVSNVESALRHLSERLDDVLPGSNDLSRRVTRAKRALRRTTGSMVDHFPSDRASQLVAETGRTVREHPLRAVLTAAAAGYCVWSLIRLANGRDDSHTLAGRFRAARDHLDPRH